MSKSKKLPIYKDGSGSLHKFLRKRIRRVTKMKVKDILSLLDKESYDIPNPKTIVNDYDWCDYVLDYRFWVKPKYKILDSWNKYYEEVREKVSRK